VTESILIENKIRKNAYKTGWCSILVGTTGSEDGPKNPLKGTSMKFLVLACYAQ